MNMKRENSFEITNVESFTDGYKIYITMQWTGNESKVDDLFIDLLDAEKGIMNDRIYPEEKVTFSLTHKELDLVKDQRNELTFYLAMYDRIINEVDGSYSKNELLTIKGPFKISFDYKQKLFGKRFSNLKVEHLKHEED